jgi:hypothetical protein
VVASTGSMLRISAATWRRGARLSETSALSSHKGGRFRCAASPATLDPHHEGSPSISGPLRPRAAARIVPSSFGSHAFRATCDRRKQRRSAVARGYLLAWDREASPDLRFVFPPGLAAGTSYRGYGCGNQTGGANPACAAGGARSAGSGDCALASELASAAMLPASMKDAIRIRIIG